MTIPGTISRSEALAELWGVIGDLLPFPGEFSAAGDDAILIAPSSSECAACCHAPNQPVIINFGRRGLCRYQAGSDLTRQRVRGDIAYVVELLLRAYSLGLHASRGTANPFVIDCELLMFPRSTSMVASVRDYKLRS